MRSLTGRCGTHTGSRRVGADTNTEVARGRLRRARTAVRAPAFDAVMFLFAGPQDALAGGSGYIALDDDSCSDVVCGPSAWFNSTFTVALGPGIYTLAGSDFLFSEEEARSGVNDVRAADDFTIELSSRTGVAFASNVTATPEPTTVALLGTGLLGVAGIARRRRALQG